MTVVQPDDVIYLIARQRRAVVYLIRAAGIYDKIRLIVLAYDAGVDIAIGKRRTGDFHLHPAETVYIYLHPGVSVRRSHCRRHVGFRRDGKARHKARGDPQLAVKQRRGGSEVIAYALFAHGKEIRHVIGNALRYLIVIRVIRIRRRYVFSHRVDERQIFGHGHIFVKIREPLSGDDVIQHLTSLFGNGEVFGIHEFAVSLFIPGVAYPDKFAHVAEFGKIPERIHSFAAFVHVACDDGIVCRIFVAHRVVRQKIHRNAVRKLYPDILHLPACRSQSFICQVKHIVSVARRI